MKNNILYCLARSPTENRFYLIDSSHVTSLQRGARSAPPVGHTRPRNGLHQGVTKLNLLQPRLVSSSGLPRQSPFALALSSPTTIPAPGPSIAGRNQSSLPSSPFSPYPHPDRRRHLPPTYKSSVFVTDNHIQHVGPARVVVLLHHPENSVQHHWRYQRTSCHPRQGMNIAAAFWQRETSTPFCGFQALTGLQVKLPKYNEIVTLTLPDGTERSGQVLEARGRSKRYATTFRLC